MKRELFLPNHIMMKIFYPKIWQFRHFQLLSDEGFDFFRNSATLSSLLFFLYRTSGRDFGARQPTRCLAKIANVCMGAASGMFLEIFDNGVVWYCVFWALVFFFNINNKNMRQVIFKNYIQNYILKNLLLIKKNITFVMFKKKSF